MSSGWVPPDRCRIEASRWAGKGGRVVRWRDTGDGGQYHCLSRLWPLIPIPDAVGIWTMVVVADQGAHSIPAVSENAPVL